MSSTQFSVRQQTAGSVVLLTGGLGFLGSVCLEQLLRLTEVKQVYLLVRGKRTASASQRVEKLLCGPLFNLLHKEAASGGRNVFSRVKVVEGDLSEPGMGLLQSDRQELLDEVDTIIHCAANLTLDASIQDTLRANYCGTRQLLQLAGEMHNLRSFVFTSTYWVNNFRPYNTPVQEEVHHVTLHLAGDPQALSHSELVDLLLSLPADQADREAATMMARLNFNSTYAFGKLLVELLVDEPSCLPGVAKAIVRPSLITGLAGDPYPGYFSGFAGCQGYCLGYGIGFFHDQSSFAFSSDNTLDLIPVDTTAALVIAAAAGASAQGPAVGGTARVYHATSAASHPQGIVAFIKLLKDFWVANPPPFSLPVSRYPIIAGRHVPSEWGLYIQKTITWFKVFATSQLLKLTGNSKHARSLTTAFKAFCVQNTIGYSRSIISTVENALALRDSIAPAERADWPCVWQTGVSPDWLDYACMCLTAMRCLAFKLPSEGVATVVPHNFKVLQGLSDHSLMQQWRQAAPCTAATNPLTSSSEDLSTADASSADGSSEDSMTRSNSSSGGSSSSDLRRLEELADEALVKIAVPSKTCGGKAACNDTKQAGDQILQSLASC